MLDRIGRFKAYIVLLLVVSLAIPLVGWNTLPKTAPRKTSAIANTVIQPVGVIPAGDVTRGQKLFMGNLHFENGGPPCMGCHNVGNNGLLGGGAMGPDLTNVSTRRSDIEINGILSNTGQVISPVMQPIYRDFPLTTQEQADLLAFVKSSAGQTESNREFLVLGISLAGFASAVAVLGFVYRGRLRGVRKALIRKAQTEK